MLCSASLQSARELTTVTWGRELAIALNQCAKGLSNDPEELDTSVQRKSLLKIVDFLKSLPTEPTKIQRPLVELSVSFSQNL